MAIKIQLLILASAILFILPGNFAQDNSTEEEDNRETTLKIMFKACIYPRISSDEVAQQFMDCYDEAPGKEIFIDCQKEAFNGRLFDTQKNFMINCLQVWNLPKYISCLSREFDAAGLDQDDAVFKVNACQLPVVSA